MPILGFSGGGGGGAPHFKTLFAFGAAFHQFSAVSTDFYNFFCQLTLNHVWDYG
jgi:hypothetical protein